ncbi:hypothetical protein [Curtobacterium flaccumfaciens]|uniref:hypothetical protein n=1 Tax=Curtobacterium flaccumfaciens TaxID=2035 RepID=UPI00159A73CB|nr:hypothetical protein [Curtobacterium flaccumfaciens]QKS87519.1 hypothetical protein FK523_08205 [Curtobacterium flaccumfaciens pv. flaccumfaciens]
MNYDDAPAPLRDALEGFSEASAITIRSEIRNILDSGSSDEGVFSLISGFNANIDPVDDFRVGGRALSALPGKALSGVSDLLARGRGVFADALRRLGDNIPTVKVSVEHAKATLDGFGVGVGRPHIEVGRPDPGSHWLHSVADRVDGGSHRAESSAGLIPTPERSKGRIRSSDQTAVQRRCLHGREADVGAVVVGLEQSGGLRGPYRSPDEARRLT